MGIKLVPSDVLRCLFNSSDRSICLFDYFVCALPPVQETRRAAPAPPPPTAIVTHNRRYYSATDIVYTTGSKRRVQSDGGRLGGGTGGKLKVAAVFLVSGCAAHRVHNPPNREKIAARGQRVINLQKSLRPLFGLVQCLQNGEHNAVIK
ncbi:hypothetical protein GEV33_003284 [Tenebrio molitor]|uniref:Uncharacterized protein n=1 Tax=Tenebrio molitor TaxID=7067 RepID=A0A8J6HSF5_TENMO|nr:hypothetical protein GEV33_003284 [Tenebrio molitor]